MQRKFTKRLPGLHNFSYTDRLERLQLQSLELRRLVTDLIWCYKIVFGHVDIDINDSLNIRPASRTRGHDYKLYKTHTAGTRRSFFSERVINAWNGLPTAVDFRTLAAFKRTLSNANLSPYLKRY